jgi:transposase
MEVLDSPEAVQRRYPDELRLRAVHLVLDSRDEAGGRRGVCTRIGQQLGVPPDTLRGWVQRAEIDDGARPGTTTSEHARMVELDRENRELRRPVESALRRPAA